MTCPSHPPSKLHHWGRYASIGLLLCLPACSGNKDENNPELASQTLLPEMTPTEEVTPPSPPPEPPETLVVIDPGEDEKASQSLIEASRAERARRAESAEPAVVITDKNLEEYQEGAQLTYLHEEPGTEGDAEKSATSTDDEAGDLAQVGEEYWRNRGLQLRTGWRESIDRIETLQGDVAQLRQRFYEEDDPEVRDTVIKPSWDRALEELAEAREEARQLEQDLESYLDLGYESGALPEWLDEGVELEPDQQELEEIERSDSTIQFEEPDIAPEDLDLDLEDQP